MLTRSAFTLLALLALPASTFAAEAGRYQVTQVAGGFVRLDTLSGAMIFCRDDVDKFSCAPLAPEGENAHAEVAPGDRAPLEPRVRKDDESAEDFDRALDMMEKAMRRFMALTERQPPECSL